MNPGSIIEAEVHVRRTAQGLGVVVSPNNIILEMAPGGPAEEDGKLKVGDVVVGIDGVKLVNAQGRMVTKLNDQMAKLTQRNAHHFLIQRHNGEASPRDMPDSVRANPTPLARFEEYKIPANKVFLTQSMSLRNIETLFQSGCIDTHYTFGPQCERKLECDLGAKKVLLVSSGTGALEMCALCVGAEKGVEVIVPSYTFVSTASAFVTHGATPVFVDVRADTQNIDESKIEAAITPRTRAICCVHYAGVPCEMDTIMAIAKKHGLYVVEDNAHGVFSSYKGRMLGTIGDVAALSFHYTKNIVCGEGGAVVINNPTMIRTACISWEKGTNRMDFLEGKVDKYYWVDKGGSFVMSEILAAVLHAQLEQWQAINGSRMHAWDTYHAGLEELERQGKLQRPIVPEGCVHNAHIYYIRVSDAQGYARIKELAKERKVGIQAHYLALHQSPAAAKYGVANACPEAESCAATLLRLPVWVGLTDSELANVVALVQDALADGTSDK